MFTKNNLLLFILILLSTLMLGQVVYAQGSGDCSIVPQWVRDRQQYETSYVYMPAANPKQTIQATANIPQWVRDRQQYETSYVYLPTASDLHTTEITSAIPQWVRDRQQYETTYVYVPMMAGNAQTSEVYC